MRAALAALPRVAVTLHSTVVFRCQVGVVGLGLMGHGIAQTAAERGFEVRYPMRCLIPWLGGWHVGVLPHGEWRVAVTTLPDRRFWWLPCRHGLTTLPPPSAPDAVAGWPLHHSC